MFIFSKNTFYYYRNNGNKLASCILIPALYDKACLAKYDKAGKLTSLANGKASNIAHISFASLLVLSLLTLASN
jgi:hypothetical protein